MLINSKQNKIKFSFFVKTQIKKIKKQINKI